MSTERSELRAGAGRNVPISLPSLGEEEWRALREPIESGWVTQGPKVAAFERAFAERHGVRHALATTSCTTALHLALVALGIGEGDEVIVPAFTWISTANVVLFCGGTPVLVDVDPVTFAIDPAALAAAVTARTRAVMAVHLFGLCADMDAIRAALPARVAVVEDAACAAGSADKGRPAGSMGELGCFSFHPRKSITTGEGGMVTTNDDALAELVNKLRNHGASVPEEARHLGPKPYLLADYDLLGFNYRMTDLQGAIGLVQLGKLDAFIDERAGWAAWYRDELAGLVWLRAPAEPEGGRHGWQAFVCTVDAESAPMPRNELMERLQARGVSTRPGTHAVHLQNYYARRFDLRPEDFPHARDCDRQTLALPLHNRMTPDDYRYVVDCLREVAG